MKTLKILFYILLAALVPRFASADLVGPYTADANTLFLLHFDDSASASVVTNYGTKGGFFYTVVNSTSGNGVGAPPTNTAMLGQPAYVNGATNFHTCITNPAAGDLVGYDFNHSGAYDGDVSSSSLSPDALALTNLNIGNGGQSPFTIEALIRPAVITANEEIVCTDSSAGSRAFQFRITSSTLQFQFINGGQAVSGAIPTTGNDAFVAGNWYHVAISYNGTTATLYWTLLNPTNGAAHVLTSASLALGTTQGATTGPLVIGNENRNSSAEQFQGSIDEVRISSVARGSGQMQFFSPLVTITQSPVSQNVDYNQPVTFSVSASSQFGLGYQWRFNSNSIAGATNTSYVITNVAASNAGYYDCIVTNTIGNLATSSEALLVVGAANFLANRYSFNTSSTDPNSGLLTTPDSIGGQTGTNFGNATVTGGQLVLDGSTGTYMQLPRNLYNGGNATALTFEFWATFGSNPNNVYVFAFGVTNYVVGQGIVGFNHAMYSPHNGGGGQTASATPGDPQFSQTATATGVLDGQTVHVAVVFDPPNKLLSIYTNGVLEAVNTNFTVNISSLNDQFSYIGQSLWAADPYLNASIDELRIFKGALSAISIKQSQDQGPNTLLADGPGQFVLQPVSTSVPAGQTATFTAAAVGYLPVSYQWFKNGTLIPGATNASYSFTTALGDNGSTFLAHATNIIGVTTYVTNSATATLTVFLPPTLAWLDAADGGADSSWNTTSLNWTNAAAGGGVLAFAQTNGVLFDNRGSGSPNVDLEQTIVPYNITVNATTDYLLTSSGQAGSLAGQANLTKLNSDTLIIDLTNNLSGATTIAGGKLQVGNGDSFGSLGSGPVTNSATLSFNRGDAALIVGNPIHGTGTVSYDGYGTVNVLGASDYTGSTLLNQGILNLQSSTGLGAATTGTVVGSGAQLYITANVNVSEPLTLNSSGDGNGALRKGGAGVTTYLGAVSLASDSTIGVDGGATLTLSNTVSGPGPLTAVGTGTLALNVPNTYIGGTTLNGPVIAVNANGAFGPGAITVNGAGRFVIADGLNLTNAITANSVSPGAATGLLMVNDNTNGTITTVSGPLALNATPASGGDFAGPTSSGYLNVTGTVTKPGATYLSIRYGNVRFAGAGSDYPEIQIRANTTSLGASNGIATDAVMDIAGNGSTTVPTYFDLNGFSQTLAGLKNAVTPANLAWVTNSSATPATLTLDLGTGNSYDFGGSIVGNLALVLKSGAQTLDNSGTALNGLYTYTGNTVVNGGTLYLATGVNLSNSPSIIVASGATLDASASGLALSAAQTLKGSGTVNGNVTGGGVSPGPGIGLLTVNGNLALTGLTTFDVNKTLNTNDQLIVSGTVTYGGTLFATNLGGSLNIGDSFTVVSAASSAGNFSAVTGTAGSGKGWSFNPTNGVLSVIATAANLAPTNLTATVSGSSLILKGAGGSAGGTFHVLSSTNLLIPRSSWITNSAGVFDGSGNLNVTNAITPGVPQSFYLISVP